MTCLKTALVAVAGDDTNRSGVDTGADKTVHVIMDQVFNLKVSDKPLDIRASAAAVQRSR